MKKQKSMWGGRFTESPDKELMSFGASVTSDIILFEVDIEGSIAWAEVLRKAGVLTNTELTTIVSGLTKVKNELYECFEAKIFPFEPELEDVHMFVESRLTKLIGKVGGKLHTGRSRNDQVALDERMYVMRSIEDVTFFAREFQHAILGIVSEHINTIAPSYTHLRQAQPVRLAHYFMSWFWMVERDKARLRDAWQRADVLPLGSGAIAGCGIPVDRKFLAKKLGFSAISENSIDATSDRDYIIEYVSAASMLMMHLSRMCEDLIIWSSAEFGFIDFYDHLTTGSSMMPQKKNPDFLELVRGKTGRVYGNLITLLTVMKSLPMGYGKDMQEDKEPLFDTVLTVCECLIVMKKIVKGLTFNKERLKSVIDDSIFATDIADYLTLKGIPFREAHHSAGQLVLWAKEHGTTMAEIPLKIYKKHSPLFKDDILNIFNLTASTDRRSVPGGTSKSSVVSQVKKAKEILRKEKR